MVIFHSKPCLFTGGYQRGFTPHHPDITAPELTETLNDGPVRLERRAPPCFISCGETTAMCSPMSIEIPFDWIGLIFCLDD